jgi:hypothetical protein
MFENEDVSIDPDATFLLFSEQLPNDILHVYDIEDKTNIVEIARLRGAGDHTMTCINKCQAAYGSDGTIVDLRNPAEPKFIAKRRDPNNWHAQTGLSGSGAHDVTEYKDGFVVTAPIDDAFQALDVRDPAKPKVIARGGQPTNTAYLFHSARWPNGGNDRFILMQGEDNFNPRCNKDANGPFLTYDTQGFENTKTFKLVDQFAVQNGTFTDGNPPANGLGCSAHWFEEHPTFNNGGLVAMGYYEHGTRFFDITDTGKIKEAGYFLPTAGSTSAAYWVDRNDPKNKLVYAVDYTRGIDILKYVGPALTGGGGTTTKKKPNVKMIVEPVRTRRGGPVTFSVRLAACERDGLDASGTKIFLQKKSGATFKNIASKTFDKSCKEVFKKNANFKEATFRAAWPAQKKGYKRGRSQDTTVRTRG